ncbi:MAG: DUF1211 domain-containing protein [Actinobacteria bacterium]|nr:DUF1211 domain-containing protein [Actinomycetota bacterium]
MTKPRKELERLDPGRTIAFSDGVVAIAITILILPLVAIELPKSADQTNPLGYVWLQNGPLIASFLITWVVIITFWMTHHRIFRNFESINQAVVGWNILWVFAIIVLPFPMNLLYQVESKGSILDADRQVVTFYIGTMAVISFAMSMINRQAIRHPQLLTEEAHTRGIGESSVIGWTFSVYLILLTLCAIAFPNIALYGLFGLWVLPNAAEAIRSRAASKKQASTT